MGKRVVFWLLPLCVGCAVLSAFMLTSWRSGGGPERFSFCAACIRRTCPAEGP